MWEVAKLALGQLLTLLPSKFVSPFLDSKGKDTAPCHHSIGIRIIKHMGLFAPRLHPVFSSNLMDPTNPMPMKVYLQTL